MQSLFFTAPADFVLPIGCDRKMALQFVDKTSLNIIEDVCRWMEMKFFEVTALSNMMHDLMTDILAAWY